MLSFGLPSTAMARETPGKTEAHGKAGSVAMVLHGFFRSAASWRIRIALGLKGLEADHVSYKLRRGDQRAPGYLAINPQGLVPTLVTGDGVPIIQSVAIIEWLDETHPHPPLLPGDAAARARVRGFALVLAADTHPLQNLGVLNALRDCGVDKDGVAAWAARVNAAGLAACEALLEGAPGPFCFGGAPTLADICLVPQLGNARRFGVDVGQHPRLLAREAACMALPAFADAVPERQADAE